MATAMYLKMYVFSKFSTALEVQTAKLVAQNFCRPACNVKKN